MQVAPQPEEPVVVSEQPTQHFSPELGLGTVVNATDVVDALTVGGLLDLGPTSTYYVGANGFGTVTAPASPVCAEEPVVDVVGVDRKLFDAANAAKARTHLLGHRLPRWRIQRAWAGAQNGHTRCGGGFFAACPLGQVTCWGYPPFS